jgi:ketosteroid isomerase-like protein
MKRFFLVALMLFAATSLFAADHHNKGTGKGKAQGNKAGLEHAVHELFEAIKAGNVEKVRGTYTADYTFTGPDGKMISGEERIKVMSSGAVTVVNVTDINARTYGPTGVVTGEVTTKNASGATEQTRFTQTWTWQGGRWRLAASHVTRIA